MPNKFHDIKHLEILSSIQILSLLLFTLVSISNCILVKFQYLMFKLFCSVGAKDKEKYLMLLLVWFISIG